MKEANTFQVDPEHVRRIRLTVGLLILMQGFFNLFFADPTSLSTSRWSWIYRSITAAFGPYGYSIFQAGIGLDFIAWSKRKSSND